MLITTGYGFWSYAGWRCVECLEVVANHARGYCGWCRGEAHRDCTTVIVLNHVYIAVCKSCMDGD